MRIQASFNSILRNLKTVKFNNIIKLHKNAFHILFYKYLLTKLQKNGVFHLSTMLLL